MVTIGKNILENLTTGMYADSKVSFREYVQNACDQIDKAVRLGIINATEGCIDIYIEPSKRYISIKDNATGVLASEFQSDLGDIANSNKDPGENKGFRGIGRLCGLAYCKTLKFSTSYQGETVKSIMTCDAEKMRKMLRESKKYTVEDVLTEIVRFEQQPADASERFFEVELFDINSQNTDLLDEKKVKQYLSFVAPVPYKREFLLYSQIYNHASDIQCKIDEYKVLVNGEQILKAYTTRLKEESGKTLKNYDEISRLEFKNFYNQDGSLIAWMWYGVSRFEKAIPKNNVMRGLRLRQSNIQIGNDNSLHQLFKESRGNSYFVGEVFAISNDLIPNSQRDYFNETTTKVLLEDMLRRYFHETLHKLYHGANEIKNAYKRQEDYLEKIDTFKKKSQGNEFIDEDSKIKFKADIEKAKIEADKALRRLDKYEDTDEASPLTEVKKRIGDKFKGSELTQKAAKAKVPSIDKVGQSKKGTGYAVDALSKLNKNERKLVSKIFTVINNNAPNDIAESLIEKIKEEFK